MLSKAMVAACLILVLPVAASAQSPSPPADPPSAAEPSTAMEQPLTGDNWSYEVRDAITGTLKSTVTFTITDVTPTEIAVRSEVLGNPNFGYFVYDRSWNLAKSPTWNYSPNDGSGIKLPLDTGRSWKFQNNQINVQHGVSFRRSGTSKITAQESITTSAGTFDTSKIETSVDIRNVNDPTKKESTTTTMWYAPSIDHWVKLTTTSSTNGHVAQNISMELVGHGRR